MPYFNDLNRLAVIKKENSAQSVAFGAIARYLNRVANVINKIRKIADFGLKPRPNDRSMSTQHIATLLGATACVRLATVLRCVATCWALMAQV